MSKLTIDYLKKEICKRDDAKGTGYDLRVNHVSACLGHLFDILAEEYHKWLNDNSGAYDPPQSAPVKFYMGEIQKRLIKIQKAEARKSKRPTGKKGR